METLWTQMQLKEWLWVNPNHFYIWQMLMLCSSNGALTETFSLEIRNSNLYSTKIECLSELTRGDQMKIKMKVVTMTGLYNGKPIPKKDEIWETDKNNAVDLIEKGWAEAS